MMDDLFEEDKKRKSSQRKEVLIKAKMRKSLKLLFCIFPGEKVFKGYSRN